MFFSENILLAFRSLKANPLRSVLILFGMAVGIGAVLHVVALGEMTQRKISEQLSKLGSNVLLIRPGVSRMRGVRTAASRVNLKWKESKELSEISEVITAAVPTYSAQAMVVFRDQNWMTKVTGTTGEYPVVNNDDPIEGRFFNQEEIDRKARIAVLGATVHEKLFGDRSPIGETIQIKSKRFTVIGLLGAKGEAWSNPDDQIFIPLTTAQERLFGVSHLSSILAQVRSAEDYDESLFDIETILRRNHRLDAGDENDFRVRRQDLFLATIQETNKELGAFIMVIALVSLLVGGIGTSGGLVFNHFKLGAGLMLSWAWIVDSFLICAAIGVLAGIYPALRAANRNVIEALRYE